MSDFCIPDLDSIKVYLTAKVPWVNAIFRILQKSERRMTPIDQYIYSQPNHLGEVLDFLNVHILSIDSDIKASLKWKVPYYTKRQSLCYLNVIKTGKVELNFLKGYLFDNKVKQYLEFRKRTMVGGILMANLEDIDMEILTIVFNEALRLDN